MCGEIQDRRPGEIVMAQMIKDDLGVTIDPQALRMFIRSRWSRLTPLAHRIHEDSAPPAQLERQP